MARSQRSVRSKSSLAQNANSATRCQITTATRFAILQTSATDASRHKCGHLHRQTFNKSRSYKRNDRDHKSHYRHDDRNHKSLPKRKDKAFEGQPCHIHGPKSQHSYDKCSKNPKNQDKNFYDKKRSYKAHHNNKNEAIEDKESRVTRKRGFAPPRKQQSCIAIG